MRVAKAAAGLMLFLWFLQCVGVVAQDEMDLEALLDDLSSTPAQEEAATPAPVDVPVEAAEPFVSEEIAPVEPAAVEEAVSPLPVDVPVEAAEPFVFEETAPVEAPPPEAELVTEEMPAEPADAMPIVEVPAELLEELAPEMMPPEEAIPEVAAPPAPVEEAAPVESDMADIEDILGESAPEAEVSEAPVAEPVVEEPETAEPMPAPEAAIEPAEAPAEPGEAGLPADGAKQLAMQEEVRRQAMEVEGLRDLEDGFKALERGDFEGAIKNFQNALAKIPARPLTAKDRERAHWGHAEADYRIAQNLFRMKRDDLDSIKQAARNAERALEHVSDHRPAASLLAKIRAQQERLEREALLPVPAAARPEVMERGKKVSELIAEGKDFFDIKDYNAAEARFVQVLATDEYNTDAMRFLKKIEERRYEAASKEREATVAKAVRTVRDTWNPPIRDVVEIPPSGGPGQPIDMKTEAMRVEEKMRQIMIPSIEFRQVNINDVVNFLVDASIKQDREGDGVNIVLHLRSYGEEEAPVRAPTPPGPGGEADFMDSEFGDMGGFGGAQPAAAGPGTGIPSITLNLRRISLYDALNIITEVAGLRYRIEGRTVMITPAGYARGPIITRLYPVQPSIFGALIERESEDQADRGGEFIEMGAGTTMTRAPKGQVEAFFRKLGVPFPVGTTITYNEAMGKLIVANTAENLDIFERILQQLNVVPQQVEIEARFIEIAQHDLEEMGLEWILTDNYEFAQESGGLTPLAARQRAQVNADSRGATKGLRFFGIEQGTASITPGSAVTRGINQSVMGNILSVSTVLTNPEVQMILHALSMHGGADLLSAPRVTTRAGASAVIEVVREIIYPTEFEVTQPTIQSEGGLVTPPTVTPGGFETRETGVILNVTPLVTPDGYTIDLNLSPEVSDLVDWIQYGSTIVLSQPIQNPLTGLLIGSREREFTYNIPQPIFSSRNVATSISIWDGQTVVMGGLIREELTRVMDKIPVLGDIPLLGKLFRSEGTHSRKMNLLIFVTARLVDPAGRPIHTAEAMVMPGMRSGAGVTEGGAE